MANQNIRVPKQGVTANSRRIAQAVDNQAWQEFRLSLKGKSTKEKIAMLRGYYENPPKDASREDVHIRIDNYLKALARGGQLGMGVTLQKALEAEWRLEIRR